MMRGTPARELVVYVGTRKLAALEGEIREGEPRVFRHAVAVNPDGLEGGLVTHLQKASSSVRSLIESVVGTGVLGNTSCYVVLGNAKLKTYHFSSAQYFQGASRVISPFEIRAVVDQTRSVATLPLSEFVLQALPESFLINDLGGIRNPLGLEARRLGVDLKIMTMDFQAFRNLHKIFEMNDLEVEGFFPKTLTLSEAVLSDEEKKEGTLLVDVADDVTHVVIWKNGFLAGTEVVELGGRYLTSRLATAWELPLRDAERVKEQYGSLEENPRFGEEIIPLVERNGKGQRLVPRSEFHESFLKIGGEWLAALWEEASRLAAAQKVLYPHFVFTGGSTRLDGFLEFLQGRFSQDARLGFTRNLDAPTELMADPSLAAALGMYRWLATKGAEQRRLFAPRTLLEKTLTSARDWLAAYF